uniref:Uncharacterized protein n=1 Tax=Fagus sylvatica TaxID=28930 RepID=A0A2N9I2T5_FAGSY
MGSESEMATFKMMNQDFVKLDRFDGTNFTRWKDKLMFLLTELKIAYVLDPNLSKLPEPTDNDSDQLKAQRKKRKEDEVVIIAMGSESKMATFKMMNQDFVKLDRFDGMNFTRWKDKLMFLLTELKIAYVLDPNLSKLPEPTDNDSDQLKAQRKKREEDEVVCRGHILNTLSDRLYDLFTSMKSPKEIWEALEFKYKTEKQDADKFLIMKYFEFAMVDNISVMDQVHELQVLMNKLRDLKKQEKQKKNDHKVPNKANMVEENSDIVAMVSNLHISMISELNMADAKSKSLDWWYDTSATVHVCNNKSHFKS